MRGESVSVSGAASQGEVSDAIERWLAHAIITPEQATRMRGDVAEPLQLPRADGGPSTPVPSASRTALVTEALGYLGGVIIVVAVGLVVGNVWDELSVRVRLAIVGAITVLLLVAGTLIPVRVGATGVRLRSVLWLASSAALAALLALGASEWSDWKDEALVTFAALGTALYSAGLWVAHRHLLQHVAVFGALLIGVEAGVSLLPHGDSVQGLGAWGIGAAWLALAWGGLIPGRRVGTVLGAVGMIVGTITTLSQGWGVVLALATISTLIGLALIFRDLYLLGVAAIGTLLVLPSIMRRYFPGALAPALALLCVGVLLVVAAVVTTRRRAAAGPGGEPRWAIGTRPAGILVAALIVASTSAVVVALGVG